MYIDLKEVYWWNGMKKHVVKFVEECPNCQQVKAKHQRMHGLAQDIKILTWMLEDVNMEFVVVLLHT